MSLPSQIVDIATEAGLTLTAAESCTGGMVAVALTDIAGASAVFERSFITYSDSAKTDLLGVEPATLQAYGAVSEPVARQMAEGARAAAKADIAVSITGIAGPGGSEFKPEGRVCFGISTKDGTSTEVIEFGGQGRAKVRALARDHALDLLLQAVSKKRSIHNHSKS